MNHSDKNLNFHAKNGQNSPIFNYCQVYTYKNIHDFWRENSSYEA